ncbi:hypothetical protein K443DRAFT_629303 [Laccaria amethystina LaAM-08-1]|uniref:Uncharacterized protein n=1 Tax=Laccaria amethystina LaAM-08-1 TaxID=1095629 RepID=A0A0C9WYP8_9AGAR|nr:hypothetical protein K443DRAFT_629303 [Laccaria amethystina LaAM-08-1]
MCPRWLNQVNKPNLRQRPIHSPHSHKAYHTTAHLNVGQGSSLQNRRLQIMNASTLIESLISLVWSEESTRLSLKGNSGPGLSQDDPMAVVVELRGDEKRGPPPKPRSLSDSVPHEPRNLYYRIYDKGGAIVSKLSLNPDDECLGRVDTLFVTPPHTIVSLGSRIANAEGIAKNKIQFFEGTDGDHLMNDINHLYLEQTDPGCAEDEPIAVVCVERKAGGASNARGRLKRTPHS